MDRSLFGALRDGTPVEAITLANGSGMQVRIITFGASIQAVLVPDRDGVPADVCPGFSDLAGYVDQTQYFGATVGRVANRIERGRFPLDGRDHQLPVNEGANSLHGGPCGFDRANWTIALVEGGSIARVSLRHISPDGDQNYPGTMTVTATWSLDEANVLSVEYRATTDRPTIVNLTSHAYWNLAGDGSPESAMGHLLTIPADHYLPIDAASIPTGEFRAVEGTPFDFRRATPIRARVRDCSDEQIRFARGYDHNWVIARVPSLEPRLLARVEHRGSGRIMDVLSNQPGLQFYSGNLLDGTVSGKANRLYRMGDAVALEPQIFPNTPNRPEFGTARLAPGETYRNIIIWRFATDAG